MGEQEKVPILKVPCWGGVRGLLKTGGVAAVPTVDTRGQKVAAMRSIFRLVNRCCTFN